MTSAPQPETGPHNTGLAAPDEINLCGRVCPYPVVEIIRAVDQLQSGQKLRCLVDDPLALKAVPEELEEYPDMTLTVSKHAMGWKMEISRN